MGGGCSTLNVCNAAKKTCVCTPGKDHWCFKIPKDVPSCTGQAKGRSIEASRDWFTCSSCNGCSTESGLLKGGPGNPCVCPYGMMAVAKAHYCQPCGTTIAVKFGCFPVAGTAKFQLYECDENEDGVVNAEQFRDAKCLDHISESKGGKNENFSPTGYTIWHEDETKSEDKNQKGISTCNRKTELAKAKAAEIKANADKLAAADKAAADKAAADKAAEIKAAADKAAADKRIAERIAESKTENAASGFTVAAAAVSAVAAFVGLLM